MGLSRVRGLLVSSVRLSASGPVDVATAWERYYRFAAWSTWSPQLRRVDTALDHLTAGATGKVIGPVGVSAVFVVTDLDEADHRWRWTVRRGPVSISLEHGVDVGGNGHGSTTWLVLQGPTPIVLGYAPLAWYALHRLVTLRASDEEVR